MKYAAIDRHTIKELAELLEHYGDSDDESGENDETN